MRIPHVYTPQDLRPGRTLTLEEKSSHHILRVLRMPQGARLTLFNGDGHDYPATLETVTGKRACLRVDTCRNAERESPLHITLGQAISRGERMDYTLQKSVELGVARITPLWSQRTQVRLDGKRLDKRMAHWQAVLIAACEQSGRTRLPVLDSPQELKAWCRTREEHQTGLMLDPHAGLSLQAVPRPGAGIVLLIGAEGGLSQNETEAATAAGFIGIRLGPRILRTETAALAAIGALQTLWGDLG